MLFILQTLIRWRKLIILSGLGAAVVMGVISFLLPKWYMAAASVFPPEPDQFGSSARRLMAQTLQVPMLGPNAIGIKPATIYVDILQSRRVSKQIIDEFSFMEVYKIDRMTETLEELQSHSSYTVLDNGLLKVGFEDKDPERAAAVTNRFVELLDDFNRQLNVTRASRTKEFIANQIEMRSEDLRKAEEDLTSFQKTHQTLDIDLQLGSVIDIVSTLSADAIALEVELQVLRQYASQNSQEYLRKKNRYDEITRQLQKFKVAETREGEDLVRSYLPTLDTVPERGLEMARRIRTVKIEEKVLELLIEQYERARIDEARDVPTVQILDTATVPEIKSRPKRKVLILVGGLVGIGWSSLSVLFLTVWRQENESSTMIRSLFGPLMSDFNRILRRKG